uniref:Uncharacterized protein n=1 Tax=Rhizophora mucronata TaxID=61149 RepID=A0A2P2NQ74_RHIMU
MILANVASL